VRKITFSSELMVSYFYLMIAFGARFATIAAAARHYHDRLTRQQRHHLI
jgi:hypothetical protein